MIFTVYVHIIATIHSVLYLYSSVYLEGYANVGLCIGIYIYIYIIQNHVSTIYFNRLKSSQIHMFDESTQIRPNLPMMPATERFPPGPALPADRAWGSHHLEDGIRIA